MTKINCRHNAMKVNSIEMFLNLKGGLNGGIRDVYFVRALGEQNEFGHYIEEIDKKMDLEMSKKRLVYKRICGLPRMCTVEESEYYSRQYENFCVKKKVSMKQIDMSTKLEGMIAFAIFFCTGIYKEMKQDISATMQKNFGTKLLFWLDSVIGEDLNGWSQRSCIKIIADNVQKEQEYMFYLFLTFLGCDVLLIQNRADIVAEQKLRSYSTEIYLGEYGKTTLCKYIRSYPKDQGQKAVQEQQSEGKEKSRRVEKSYEELALLASFVVQIAVYNRDGEGVGSGSGIMIGRNGYILTNYHVIATGCSYSIRIEGDDTVYMTKEVIKYNDAIDLAVIRIEKELEQLPIYHGERELVRGQKVVAIGSPLGLFNSVSDGIISGFRKINDVDMIQFTAPISHGSSGGAVLNMQGEVIGISTAGIDEGQNINLAIGYDNIRLFTNGFID